MLSTITASDVLTLSTGLYALGTLYLASILTLYVALIPQDKHSIRSVAILVLGDIGRSPRMMYHAQSFAETGFQTDIIGYGGSKPIPALKRLPLVQLRYLPQLPKWLTKLPFVFVAPIKVTHQVVSILRVLLVEIPQAPEFILVQNPPSIPSLAVVALVSHIRGSKVIIDWHNLGYSILALRLGPDHLFVKIAKWLEATFGRKAYAHLFVTQAMHDHLSEEWSLQGRKAVLHDRPPRSFHRSTSQEVHDLFVKLMPVWQQPIFLNDWLPPFEIPYSSPVTDTINPSGAIPPSPTAAIPPSPSLATRPDYISASPFNPNTKIHYPSLRSDRPALVVSSTSWTPDEDFGVLKDALVLYEARANAHPGTLPKLMMIVTGKGPMRRAYMDEVAKLQEKWKWVRCVSVWLDPEDYPLLLGSCDLGVSLHSSSSALDLPMKIVDMFGCGLPVCALKFKCLDELVKENINGLVFDTAAQLAIQLEALLAGFPSSPKLSSLRQEMKTSGSEKHVHAPRHHGEQRAWEWTSWDENWANVMRPLVLRDVGR